MPTDFRLSFAFTVPVARQAFLAYFWRTKAVLIFVFQIVLGLSISSLTSPMYGPIALFFTGALTVFFSTWLGTYRLTARMASSSTNPLIDGHISEDEITFTSQHRVSTLKWPYISVVNITRNFVYLTKAGTIIATIPISGLSTGALALLIDKVKSNGWKI